MEPSGDKLKASAPRNSMIGSPSSSRVIRYDKSRRKGRSPGLDPENEWNFINILLYHSALNIVRFKNRQLNHTHLHTNQVNPKESAIVLTSSAPQLIKANHSAIRSVILVLQAMYSSLGCKKRVAA
jgi:hypothetical protein